MTARVQPKAAAAAPAAAVGTGTAAPSPAAPLDLESLLWDVCGLLQATEARTFTLADQIGVSSDALEPLRRLCAMVGRQAQRIALELADEADRQNPQFNAKFNPQHGRCAAGGGRQGGAA
jgi:hypothetical protein